MSQPGNVPQIENSNTTETEIDSMSQSGTMPQVVIEHYEFSKISTESSASDCKEKLQLLTADDVEYDETYSTEFLRSNSNLDAPDEECHDYSHANADNIHCNHAYSHIHLSQPDIKRESSGTMDTSNSAHDGYTHINTHDPGGHTRYYHLDTTKIERDSGEVSLRKSQSGTKVGYSHLDICNAVTSNSIGEDLTIEKGYSHLEINIFEESNDMEEENVTDDLTTENQVKGYSHINVDEIDVSNVSRGYSHLDVCN